MGTIQFLPHLGNSFASLVSLAKDLPTRYTYPIQQEKIQKQLEIHGQTRVAGNSCYQRFDEFATCHTSLLYTVLYR